MIELVIVSGKGGTGKTSVVGALAALAQYKVLVDCDVDAADLHLILNHTLRDSHRFIGGRQASIIKTKCNGCGLCQEFCRFDAIRYERDAGPDGREWYVVDPYACDGCGVCVRHCPEEAINFGDVVSGEWYISSTPYGPLVHARLGLAQANSGKLVSLLRRQARELASHRNIDLVIIDGPPGIGCPVIASITGAAYVLIVTEPSMSAMHDMERLLELTRHFGIPAGICINKADINSDLTAQIEANAAKQQTPILGRIPFDTAVTAAQLAGTTVVEHSDTSATGSLRQLWSGLSSELESRSRVLGSQQLRNINQ